MDSILNEGSSFWKKVSEEIERKVPGLRIKNVRTEKLQGLEKSGKSVHRLILLTEEGRSIHYVAKRLLENGDLIFEQFSVIARTINSENLAVRCVDPVCYIGDERLLIMEYAVGGSLKKHVFMQLMLRRIERLRDICFNLGVGLATFHQMSASDEAISFKELIEETLKASATSKVFGSGEKEAITRNLSSLSRGATEFQMPLATQFNDWTLRNFMFGSDGRICLFDIDSVVQPSGMVRAPVWNDVYVFLSNLEGFSKFSPAVREKHLKYLGKAFFAGYQSICGEIFEDKLFSGAHYLFLVRGFIGLATRRTQERFRGRLNRRYLNKLRQRLLVGIEADATAN